MPNNFERVLTVIRTGSGTRQTWGVVGDALNSFDMSIAILHNEDTRKLKQFYSGRFPVLVHPFLHKAVKLTFPWDIGNLSQDGIIKNEISQGSLGEAVAILSPTIFNPVSQP